MKRFLLLLLIFPTFLMSELFTVGNSGGPNNFNTIQDAVDAAESNASNTDIITVYEGTYLENVEIRESLTLQSNCAASPDEETCIDNTVIDGSSADMDDDGTYNGSCILLRDTDSGDLTQPIIQGLTIEEGQGTKVWENMGEDEDENIIWDIKRYGGGIMSNKTIPTIINNRFRNNGGSQVSQGGHAFISTGVDIEDAPPPTIPDPDDVAFNSRDIIDLEGNTWDDGFAFDFGTSLVVDGFVNYNVILDDCVFDAYDCETFSDINNYAFVTGDLNVDLQNITANDCLITQDVYVDLMTGSDNNNGLTADTAFGTLQYALSMINPTATNSINIYYSGGVILYNDFIFPTSYVHITILDNSVVAVTSNENGAPNFGTIYELFHNNDGRNLNIWSWVPQSTVQAFVFIFGEIVYDYEIPAMGGMPQLIPSGYNNVALWNCVQNPNQSIIEGGSGTYCGDIIGVFNPDGIQVGQGFVEDDITTLAIMREDEYTFESYYGFPVESNFSTYYTLKILSISDGQVYDLMSVGCYNPGGAPFEGESYIEIMDGSDLWFASSECVNMGGLWVVREGFAFSEDINPMYQLLFACPEGYDFDDNDVYSTDEENYWGYVDCSDCGCTLCEPPPFEGSEDYFSCDGECINNVDADEVCDELDDDIDGDGWNNVEDNCPYVFQTAQPDLDNDGLGNGCDGDIDGDGVPNSVDTSNYGADAWFECSDIDSDGCDDCSSGYFNPLDDGCVDSAANGDVNSDNVQNVLDIVAMVAFILGYDPLNYSEAAGDLNADGTTNILDVIQLVNYILGN